MGWSDLHTPWSVKNVHYIPEELTIKLKHIISEEKKRKILTESPILMPQKKYYLYWVQRYHNLK